MKYFVKIFVVTLLILIYTHASAEQNIAFLDMKYVLNNSKAGKGAQDFLQNSLKKNQKKFSDAEDELRKKVIEYQSERRMALEKITKQRSEARQVLLKELDPMLKAYVVENGISLIIDKKHVVMGNNALDITNIIVDKLNKVLPSLKLK